MPSVSRPDTLPFFLPRSQRIGLYYHGFVEGGQLELPTEGTWPHPQPSNGDAYLVQHPRAAEPTLDADETARLEADGQQILSYAYLSGGSRDIGGQSLGSGKWLYCDADNTWILRWVIEDNDLCIYLDGLFGRFGQAVDAGQYDMTPRKLLTYAFTEDNQAVMDEIEWVVYQSMSKTGAKSCFNLMQVYESPYQYYDALHRTAQRHLASAECLDIMEVLTITVSGDGGLVEGAIGSGISAAATTIVSDYYDTIWTDTEVTEPTTITGCACPGTLSNPCSTGTTTEGLCVDPSPTPPRGADLWYSSNGILFYFVDSGGSLKTVEYSLRTTVFGTQTYDGSCSWRVDAACQAGGACEGSVTCTENSSASVEYTLTVGGTALVFGPAAEESSSESTMVGTGCVFSGGGGDLDTDCSDSASLSQSGWYYTMISGDYVPSATLQGSQIVIVAIELDGSARALSLENGSSVTAGSVATHKYTYDIGKSTWRYSTNNVGVV